jgi:hypothetical protein
MPQKKVKLAAEIYANCGGWFADPDLDPAMFNNLPAWRRKEILECKRIFREIPGVQAYEIIEPGTWKPYPNQKLAADYYRTEALEPEPSDLPEVPPSIKYTVPNGVPLLNFRMDRVLYTGDTELRSALEMHVALPAVSKACTVKGEGIELLREKPLDGVYAFVWRMARFQAGLDASVPVTAFWDLEDGIRLLGGPRYPATKEIAFLESRAGELARSVGLNRYEAAQRWGRALGRTL